MSTPPIEKDEKNYYHPSCEQEIIDLINYARQNSFQVRVRGSGHSMAQAIFTDECSLDYLDVCASAPDGDNVNIMLDCYTKILHKTGVFVTVQAGIHLGHDPNDPRSTEENSLLYQLHHTYGLALNDLGGITHQTVAGFLSTGSSGSSTAHSIHENVHALRFVDGKGKIFPVDRSNNNFNACLVSLGLLGVLSTVTFSCVPKFNICGKQLGTLTHEADVDIFNNNPTDGKIGLTKFLNDMDYARFLWWPQTSTHVDMGQDRLQVWQAQQLKDEPNFERKPFKLFDKTEIMMLYSYLMTLTGNIENMGQVRKIAASKEDRFKSLAVDELMKEYGMNIIEANIFANIFHHINTFILNLVTGIVEDVPLETRYALLPHFTAAAIKLLNEVDKSVNFQDHAFLGLPMDNTADDIIVPIMFTEIWVPLSEATKVTNMLRVYFKGLPKDATAFERTGNNAWELYAARASKAWMSMSYSNGEDAWKDGAFRIGPYWFIHNSASPRDLFRPIWLLLKKNKIPFRLHWGKTFPAKDDEEITAKDLVTDQYPKLQSFLALRKLRDPDEIFLNSYWRHWLGLNN